MNFFKRQRWVWVVVAVFGVLGHGAIWGEEASPSVSAGNSQKFLPVLIPVGTWKAVDLVDEVEEFSPETKKWKEDLFVKNLSCDPAGKTSFPVFVFRDGYMYHTDHSDQPQAKARFFVMKHGGKEYLFMPWISGDVIQRGEKPSFYVLMKTSSETMTLGDINPIQFPRKPDPEEEIRKIGLKFGLKDELQPFDDIRKADVSILKPEIIKPLLLTLSFNQKTIWPESLTNDSGSMTPQLVLEAGKNPGLGVRALHQQGITGKGVNVAIIDQPLTLDHPEYVGKIASYQDVGCNSDNSMHGPAVTSLLVGEDCGTAPGARVYYAAAPSWSGDAAKYAESLKWIIQVNQKLPAGEKIRVVSVSAAPSGNGSPFKTNNDQWDEAVKQAEKDGILVLDCTSHHGFIGSSFYDPTEPENPEKCQMGFPGKSWSGKEEKILAPSSLRSPAETYALGDPSYQFNGRGGLSWSIPYVAGVMALGWQIVPEFSGEKIRELLFQSAYKNSKGNSFINPPEFIRLVQKEKAKEK